MNPIVHERQSSRQASPHLRVVGEEERPRYDGTTESERRHVTVLADDVISRVAALGPSALAVYVLLERRANQRGRCWPSYQTIADDLNVSRRHVMTVVKRLVEAGFVRIQSRRAAEGDADSNEFVLPFHLSGGSEQRSLPSEHDSPGGEQNDTGGGERGSPKVVTTGSSIPSPTETGAAAPAPLPLIDRYALRYQAEPNKPGVLGDLFLELWPNRTPNYARLGQLLKQTKSGGVLMALMIEASAHHISDDPHDYLAKMLVRRHERNGHRPTQADHNRGGVGKLAL